MSAATSRKTYRSPNPDCTEAALARWRGVVGHEHVIVDGPSIDIHAKSTLPRTHRPIAVVRPGTAQEVAHVVRIASDEATPIYPVSRGKNWGYGDACPVTAGQVLLDLSRLNRIVTLDAKLAFVVVEPGVSQGQLAEHLQRHAPHLMADVTGAGPDASVVGSTLERGFGHTPYGDRCRHACGMEVALADGRLLRTGMGAYDNAQAAWVAPWGLGPSLDGLFSQSNLGVVTKLGVALLPRPSNIEAFSISFDERRLAEVVEALRYLRLNDVIRSTVHIGNDLRLLSALQSYPWGLTNGATPLPDAIRRQLRERAGFGEWNLVGGLYGTRQIVAAARREVRGALRRFGPVRFLSRRSGRLLASKLARLRLTSGAPSLRAAAQSVLNLLEGNPAHNHLRGGAWRTKNGGGDEAADLRDCGLIWLSPVLPMTAAACRELLETIAPVHRRYKAEPLLTLTAINPRALYCVMSICYDRYDPADAARARQCYEELFQTLLDRGFPPYRAGVQSMASLGEGAPTHWDVCSDIKSALDPQGIIAPGRYEPRRARL